MFEDRKDAGQRLARVLEQYKGQGVIVLAIPKGGVEVGYEVARHLNAEFSLIIARKLPYPYNTEAGFGAVAEDGSFYLHEEAASLLPRPVIERIVWEQRCEIERRVHELRGDKPLSELTGKTVILVDDGIAMGSTMKVAIALCRNRQVAGVVVATPVAGLEIARAIASLADEVVILETPPYFRAVAQVYQHWYDVSDEEVLEVMRRQTNKASSAIAPR
ncbi:MAG: phosphoribosyltransferase [Anaerolineae bacterium]